MPISRMLGLFILVQICHLENEGYRSALPSAGFPNSPTLIPSVMRHTFPRVSMVSCVHICYQTPSCVPLGDKNLCLLHVGIPSLVSRTQRGSTVLPHLDFFVCSYSHLWNAMPLIFLGLPLASIDTLPRCVVLWFHMWKFLEDRTFSTMSLFHRYLSCLVHMRTNAC